MLIDKLYILSSAVRGLIAASNTRRHVALLVIMYKAGLFLESCADEALSDVSFERCGASSYFCLDVTYPITSSRHLRFSESQ